MREWLYNGTYREYVNRDMIAQGQYFDDKGFGLSTSDNQGTVHSHRPCEKCGTIVKLAALTKIYGLLE